MDTNLSPFVFPYNLGCLLNCWQVINIWGSPMGDGINWPVREGCDRYSFTVCHYFTSRAGWAISRDEPFSRLKELILVLLMTTYQIKVWSFPPPLPIKWVWFGGCGFNWVIPLSDLECSPHTTYMAWWYSMHLTKLALFYKCMPSIYACLTEWRDVVSCFLF